MPYELEFGAQPNSASLTEFVCDQKQRPRIKNMWLTNNVSYLFDNVAFFIFVYYITVNHQLVREK